MLIQDCAKSISPHKVPVILFLGTEVDGRCNRCQGRWSHWMSWHRHCLGRSYWSGCLEGCLWRASRWRNFLSHLILLMEEIPRPTTWDVFIAFVNNGMFNRSLNWLFGIFSINSKPHASSEPLPSVFTEFSLSTQSLTTSDILSGGFFRVRLLIRQMSQPTFFLPRISQAIFFTQKTVIKSG